MSSGKAVSGECDTYISESKTCESGQYAVLIKKQRNFKLKYIHSHLEIIVFSIKANNSLRVPRIH